MAPCLSLLALGLHWGWGEKKLGLRAGLREAMEGFRMIQVAQTATGTDTKCGLSSACFSHPLKPFPGC